MRILYFIGRLGLILLTVGLVLYSSSMIEIPFSTSEFTGSSSLIVGEGEVICSQIFSPLDKIEIEVRGYGLKIYIVTASSDIILEPPLLGGRCNISEIKDSLGQLNVIFEGDSPYSGEVNFEQTVRLIIVISNELSGIATVDYRIKITERNIPIMRVRSASIYFILIGSLASAPLIMYRLGEKFWGGR